MLQENPSESPYPLDPSVLYLFKTTRRHLSDPYQAMREPLLSSSKRLISSVQIRKGHREFAKFARIVLCIVCPLGHLEAIFIDIHRSDL